MFMGKNKYINIGGFLVSVTILILSGYSQVESEWEAESMHWELKVGFLKFGEGHVEIAKDSVARQLTIYVKATSTGIFQAFFNARYYFDATIDPTTGLPIQATRHVTEGKYEKYNVVTFDHLSRPDSSVIHSQRSGERVIPKNSYDILSGFNYFRKDIISSDLHIGDSILIITYFTDQVWELKLFYDGLEEVNTLFGIKTCYRYKPEAEVGRFFRNKDAITFWFTKDEQCIPVKVQMIMVIGAITAKMTEYKTGR